MKSIKEKIEEKLEGLKRYIKIRGDTVENKHSYNIGYHDALKWFLKELERGD